MTQKERIMKYIDDFGSITKLEAIMDIGVMNLGARIEELRKAGEPIISEMVSGKNRYVLARKSVKLYMKDVVKCETQSITTSAKQTLYIDGDDAEYIKGKRVLIVDDVISTGGSLLSLENLVKQAGGEIVGKMAILAEGDAIKRDDIIYLEPLPLFDGNGNPL